MALNKAQLKGSIKVMLETLKNQTDQAASIEMMASGLSEAIDLYVKTAVVVGTDSQGGPITGVLQ